MPMTAKIYRVPALEKGLDVLEALAEAGSSLTLKELSTALGRGSNEIFRMVSCLESRGYLKRETGGAFRPSLKLHALSRKLEPIGELIRSAESEMRALSRETGESCHLGLLEDSDLVVVHRNESTMPVRLAVEVGGRFPAIHTVSGRLLLSVMDPTQRRILLERDASWRTLGLRRRKHLESLMTEAARTGLSMAVSETVEGVSDAAVTCGFPGTPLVAALAISRLTPASGKADPGSLEGPLRRCAERIQKRLGGTLGSSPSSGSPLSFPNSGKLRTSRSGA